MVNLDPRPSPRAGSVVYTGQPWALAVSAGAVATRLSAGGRNGHAMRYVPLVLASIVLIGGPTVLACAGRQAPESAAAQRAFGTEMARQGLWNEARFRFERASELAPDDPRAYNNLAVAYEALGLFEEALETYRKGLEVDPTNRVLRANYARFIDFYQAFRPFPERPADEPLPLLDEQPALEVGDADAPEAEGEPPNRKGGWFK